MLGPVSQQQVMELICNGHVVCTYDYGVQGAKLEKGIIDWSHLYKLALS